MRPGIPRRRRVWSQPFLPPGPAQHWRVNWGNPVTQRLAFFFLPTDAGYFDVVRGDVMTLKGTTSQVTTPFGTAWQLGVLAGGTQGFATTRTGDAYYQPPLGSDGKMHLSIACGAYNPGATGLPTDALYTQWCDSSNGFLGNDITVELRNLAATPRMAANVSIAGSNLQIQAPGGATSPTMTASGQGMTYLATYDGANMAAYYSSPAEGYNTTTAAKTGTQTGMDRVLISGATAALAANRAIIYSIGWFRTVTAAEAQPFVGTNGGLPPGLLRHK